MQGALPVSKGARSLPRPRSYCVSETGKLAPDFPLQAAEVWSSFDAGRRRRPGEGRGERGETGEGEDG